MSSRRSPSSKSPRRSNEGPSRGAPEVSRRSAAAARGSYPIMSIVGLLTVELHLPDAQSLKAKRMVLRRVKDRLKKFNVAIAETEYQDLWQRAALSVVAVSNDTAAVDEALAKVVNEIERVEPGTVTRTQIEFLT